MSNSWNSLFCPCDDSGALADRIRAALAALAYELYTPFGALPGKAYARSVRLFVAPAQAGWVRVLGAPDERLPARLNTDTCLVLTLAGGQGSITLYSAGQPVEPLTGLLPYLRAGASAADLRAALQATPPAESDRAKAVTSGSPFASLTGEVGALAERVDPAQAQRLFARLSGPLLRRAGNDDKTAQAAHDLVSGAAQPDWNSPAGRRIVAVAVCLSLPPDWREPDFEALRDAYALHQRRSSSPNAPLYPGDAETMARLPHALAYIPIYGGMTS